MKQIKRSRSSLFSALGVALLLSACASPAPIGIIPPNDMKIHEVKFDQSVNLIADLFFVSPEEIIRANELSPPYRVTRGQRLIIPPLMTHTVVKDETISQIAQRYQVNQQDLLNANKMTVDSTIYSGQRIKIPSKSNTQIRVTRTETIAPTGTSSSANQSLPVSTKRIEVADPEPVPTRQTQERLSQVALIKAPPARANKPKPKPPETVSAPNPRVSTTLAVQSSPKKKAKKAETPKPKPNQDVAFQVVPIAPEFIWPVRGRVASTFGAKSGGTRNDGINIVVAEGTPIKAVADGTVVYAGDTLPGFGNILIIRHDGGLMSAYAHNQKLLVGQEEAVRQGQIVARSGKTGSVQSPQLHFEIREGTKPVDPEKYLPSL